MGEFLFGKNLKHQSIDKRKEDFLTCFLFEIIPKIFLNKVKFILNTLGIITH